MLQGELGDGGYVLAVLISAGGIVASLREAKGRADTTDQVSLIGMSLGKADIQRAREADRQLPTACDCTA